MYDFNTCRLNGERVSYTVVPNYLLNQVELDNRLNPTDKLVFIRLVRYACHAKNSVMTITGAWVANILGLHRNTALKSLRILKKLGYLTDKGLNMSPPKENDTPENAQDLVNQALALVGSSKHKNSANTAQAVCNAQDLTQHKDCANLAQNEFKQDLCMFKGCAENGTNIGHSIKLVKKVKKDTNLACDIGLGDDVGFDPGAVGVALPVYASFAELEAAQNAGADFGFSSDAVLVGRMVSGSSVQAVGGAV